MVLNIFSNRYFGYLLILLSIILIGIGLHFNGMSKGQCADAKEVENADRQFRGAVAAGVFGVIFGIVGIVIARRGSKESSSMRDGGYDTRGRRPVEYAPPRQPERPVEYAPPVPPRRSEAFGLYDEY